MGWVCGRGRRPWGGKEGTSPSELGEKSRKFRKQPGTSEIRDGEKGEGELGMSSESWEWRVGGRSLEVWERSLENWAEDFGRRSTHAVTGGRRI